MNEFFQMLNKDYREVKDTLGQLKEIEDKSREDDELFQNIKEELVPHMKAEEITFYPPLPARKEVREVALEGVEEHHVSDIVFKELENMPMGQDHWGAKLSVFKELVVYRLKVEEGPIFKTAEEDLNKPSFKPS